MRKVSVGQPFHMAAHDFNAFVEAAQAHRNRALNLESSARPRETRSGLLTVRNESGYDQPQFAVLELGEVLLTPSANEAEFRSRAAFRVVAPTADGAAKLAILQEPLRAGALGKAMLFGVTPVRLDVVDEAHEFAEAVGDDPWGLRTAATGAARILYQEPGTGEGWGIVHFPVSAAGATVRLGGEPLTQADDGATPEANEVALDEALRVISVGGTYRLALNLATLYVVDPATGQYGPLSAILRLLAGNVLALRIDAPFSNGTQTGALAMKYDAAAAKHRADGAYPV